MTILPVFGEVVRAKREAAGFSQEKFAERAELDRTYVSGVERGVRNPTLLVITRIAAALGMTLGELFVAVTEASESRKPK